jgi:hypothetical protein
MRKVAMPASMMFSDAVERGIYLSQYRSWTAFFKKAGGSVRGGREWRGRIQEAAQREIDRTIAALRNESAPFGSLACRKNCAHCCHSDVHINSLEAERLADVVRQMSDARREEMLARLRAAREAYQQANKQSRREPCPFLEGSECSVYEDRPLACRGYVSSSVAFCIAELNKGGGLLTSADVPPGTMESKIAWELMVQSIAYAANSLIGKIGSMSKAVLEHVA